MQFLKIISIIYDLDIYTITTFTYEANHYRANWKVSAYPILTNDNNT